MRLQVLTLGLIAALSTACGGGGGSTAAAASNAGAGGSGGATTTNIGAGSSNLGVPTTASSSVAANSSVSANASSSINTSIVWSPTTSVPGQTTIVSSDGIIPANTVVTFGQVFESSEIASGVVAKLGNTPLPTQIDVKRLHTNGSVRHAIVSVRLPATTGALSLSLSAGTSSSGSGVTLGQALSSSVDYRVEIAETGSTTEAGATWSTTLKQALAASPTQWIYGPLTTEWRSRVIPRNGSLAHPGLRVLFDARYQNATQGRVSIAIENVESTAARGDRNYTLSIYDNNNALVYSAASLKHYAQTRHRKILYFGGAKEMTAILDIERLKNSRAIPNYANITIPSTTLTARYAAWQASNRGLYQNSHVTPNMGQTGGRPDIGPLPGWTATALISRDPFMYKIMLDQAERAAYFNTHWRDASTGEIISIDARPTFSLYYNGGSDAPYAGGSNDINTADRLAAPLWPSTVPPGWGQDTAHEPSLVYVPYLVTGDHYFLDELYFWNNHHFLQYLKGWRGGDKGWVADGQTRGQAWTLRTLGHAAWISPDSDWQKNYFTNKLNNNIAWFRAGILPSNSLGFWWSDWQGFQAITPGSLPGLSAQVSKNFGPWQHNMMAYTLFELCERGYAATDLRDFALGFSTKLFTSNPDYSQLDGTAYYLPAALVDGTTISSMAQMSHHAFLNRTTPPSSELESSNDSNGYASIAMAALAASIDSSIPNANIGYIYVRDKIKARWLSDRATFVDNPVWNIVPRSSVPGLTEAPGIYLP